MTEYISENKIHVLLLNALQTSISENASDTEELLVIDLTCSNTQKQKAQETHAIPPALLTTSFAPRQQLRPSYEKHDSENAYASETYYELPKILHSIVDHMYRDFSSILKSVIRSGRNPKI